MTKTPFCAENLDNVVRLRRDGPSFSSVWPPENGKLTWYKFGNLSITDLGKKNRSRYNTPSPALEGKQFICEFVCGS